MPYVQIERVLAKTYEQDKGNYTVHEWECSGWIDGEYTGKIKVKTLSNKMAAQVADGFEYEAEVDVFKGHTSYKIPTPKKQEGVGAPPPSGGGAPPPPRGAAPAPAPQPAPRPVSQKQVSLEQLENLYYSCLQRAKRATQFRDEQAQAAAAATLFIQATRNGIIEDTFVEPDPSLPPPSIDEDEPF